MAKRSHEWKKLNELQDQQPQRRTSLEVNRIEANRIDTLREPQGSTVPTAGLAVDTMDVIQALRKPQGYHISSIQIT